MTGRYCEYIMDVSPLKVPSHWMRTFLQGEKMKKEIWKTVPEYESYQVSNMGNVKSIDRLSSNGRKLKGKTMSQVEGTDGYLSVALCKNGKTRHIAVHRLVMLAFVGRPKQGYQVNHIDENKLNNQLSNLEYVTRIENCNHGTRNARISASNKGKPKSKSHKENISKSRKGIQFSEDHKRNISVAKKKQCGRQVQCVETGEIFEAIVDAEKSVGVKRGSNIISACKDNKRTCAGYHWRYV